MMGPREKYKKADETRRKQTARSRLGPAPIKLHRRLFKLVRFSFVKKRKESPKSIMPFLFLSLSIRLSSLSLGFGFLKADCIPFFSLAPATTHSHTERCSRLRHFSHFLANLEIKSPRPTHHIITFKFRSSSMLSSTCLDGLKRENFDPRPVDCQPSTSWPILLAHTAQRTQQHPPSAICYIRTWTVNYKQTILPYMMACPYLSFCPQVPCFYFAPLLLLFYPIATRPIPAPVLIFSHPPLRVINIYTQSEHTLHLR